MKHRRLCETLLKEKGWLTPHLVQHQGSWFVPSMALKGLCLLQNHFKADNSDIFLATFPTAGTTWVRAIINPEDMFVPKWIFLNKLRSKNLKPLSIEDAFKLFCDGVSHNGSFWDDVLEYWRASLENPTKILFMKFEEIKRDTFGQIQISRFSGKLFSIEEE
ncbi:Sulfotransferase domain [Dillenia turbinata]|uniref:Sulfotransferase n=1 Tax=Dillenia turbinata TaxID=194707 RepID=A0AAN8Z558_9MAGN